MVMNYDEIENEINASEVIEVRIDLMIGYSIQLRHSDALFALKLSNNAFTMSEKNGFQYRMARALYCRGCLERDSVNYAEALVSLEDAELILNELPDGYKSGLNKVLIEIAVIYLEQWELTSAADYYRKAINLNETLGDLEELAKV